MKPPSKRATRRKHDPFFRYIYAIPENTRTLLRLAERKNIECLFNTDLKKVAPVPNSDKIVVTTLDDKEIETDGLFVAIGHEANTDYLDEGIARDDMGRLIPDKLPKGTYVAGDVHSNIKMQIATAVGTGCTAAMEAIAYLNANE